MSKIHICLFIENTHPNNDLKLRVGGIANQVLLLLPSYEKIKEIKISIITKYSEYKSKSNRVKIYQIHRFKNYKLDSIYFIIKSFIKIIKIHKKEPIDVLNIHTFDNTVFPLILVRFLFKIPILMKIPLDFTSYILHIHLMEKDNIYAKIINFSWFKFFTNFLLAKIDFIRAINERIFYDLIELGYPRKRLIRIHNGINSKDYLKIEKQKHSITHYGFVGRLTEFKNLPFLLDVFKLYFKEYNKDKLFIYGKGPEEHKIMDFIHKNKLEENIIVLGFEKDKTKIYSNVDVIIDPAFGQGISNANLEAMCTNTFVIASNVFGNIDLIKDKISGLLFDPYNKEDLLKKLRYYKENPQTHSLILINAKNEILLNYDIDIITQKIYNFLKSRLKIRSD